jgi:hypothetical protein
MSDTAQKEKNSEEFKRFEELTRKLVSIPKKDVEKEEKKYKKRSQKNR